MVESPALVPLFGHSARSCSLRCWLTSSLELYSCRRNLPKSLITGKMAWSWYLLMVPGILLIWSLALMASDL